MYRDDPLDDEAELRALAGDEAVDALLDAPAIGTTRPLDAALDVLRVLQGWVEDDAAGGWFVVPQRRLDGRTPVEALCAGELEEVVDAASAWAAAHG